MSRFDPLVMMSFLLGANRTEGKKGPSPLGADVAESREPARGFTLLELLVVLVLVGLLSSLVFVSVAGGLFRSEERRFVQSLTQTLRRARTASLGRGEVVRFLIDGERRVFSLEGQRWKDIPEEVQVEGEGVAEIRPGVYGIVFYPDGSASGGVIDLKWADGHTDQVRVGRLLGLVRMERELS